MRRLPAVAGVLALIALAGVAVLVVEHRGHQRRTGGDPAGRLLAVLKSAEVAVPKNARVGLRQAIEPHWDSCDGQAGTFGWSDADVQVGFRSSSAPRAVLAYAAKVMARQGWISGEVGAPDGPGLRSDWTKPGPSGSGTFSVILSNNTPVRGWWGLTGTATPIGTRASGC